MIGALIGGAISLYASSRQRKMENQQMAANSADRLQNRQWNFEDARRARFNFRKDTKYFSKLDNREFQKNKKDDRAYLQDQKIGDRLYLDRQKQDARAYADDQRDNNRAYSESQIAGARLSDRKENNRLRRINRREKDAEFSNIRDRALEAGFNPLSVMGASQVGGAQTVGGYGYGSGGGGGAPGGGGGGGTYGGGGTGGGIVSGGAQGFHSAANMDQAGYAPLSSIDMLVNGLSESAQYFSDDARNQRKQTELQNDLLQIQVDQARSGVNTNVQARIGPAAMSAAAGGSETPENIDEVNVIQRHKNPDGTFTDVPVGPDFDEIASGYVIKTNNDLQERVGEAYNATADNMVYRRPRSREQGPDGFSKRHAYSTNGGLVGGLGDWFARNAQENREKYYVPSLGTYLGRQNYDIE